MISRYIKFSLFACGYLLNPINAVKTKPSACEDLEIIRGNPWTARTILMGEFHSSDSIYGSAQGEICGKTIKACSKELMQKTSKDATLALLEEVPRDKHTTCNVGQKQPLTFTENCRGWNLPMNEFEPTLQLHIEFSALEMLNTILTETSEEAHIRNPFKVEKLPQKFTNSLKNKINEKRNYCEYEINEAQKLQTLELKTYQKKHPEVKADQFFSRYYNLMMRNRFFLKHSLSLLNQLDAGFLKAGLIVFHDHYIAMNNRILSTMENSRLFIDTPNQSMVQAIKSIPKNIKKAVVIAGKSHVAKITKPEVLNTKEKHDLINHLYRDLDQLSHENPYAVLACQDSESAANHKPRSLR